jgi:hypothetical protein
MNLWRKKNGDFKGSDERSKGVHHCRKSNRSIFIAMVKIAEEEFISISLRWGLVVIKSTEIESKHPTIKF